mgnify:CR=1 FL=1
MDISVRKLPVDPGPAGWDKLLDDPPAPKVLSVDTHSDFIVIGAGFTGLAATRRLTQLVPDAQVQEQVLREAAE